MMTKTPSDASSPLKIGGGENDAASPVVDRNVDGVPASRMLISSRKIGGVEEGYVVSPVVDRNEVKVVAPVQRTIGGSGKDGVVPPVVDRNVAGVPDPRMLSSTRKIGGGEESYVVSPVVDGNKMKLVVPVRRTFGGSGKDVVIPTVVDRNVAGVPSPRMLSSTRKIGGGEDSYVVSPVVDGNKMKIVVPVQRTIGGSGEDGVVPPVVDGNKMRIEVPVPKKLLFPSGRKASYPDHYQLLVQNNENFKKSGKPMRFMFYKDGSWVDFEKSVMDVMVSGFVRGKPMIEVEMEGLKCFFDFYRMLETDLDTGKERSISWIDVNGKCFFPKVFIDSSEGSENLDKSQDIDLSNVNDNFSPNNPKIAGEELNLGKRKRGSEENEVEKGEGSSTNLKERCVVATALLPPKWPKTRPVSEEQNVYHIMKSFLLSGLRAVEPGVTVTAIHQCIRTGPMEQARFEVFKKNVEIITRARGNCRVVNAWYGTSAKNVESIMRHGFGMPRMVPGSRTHGVGIYMSPARSPQYSHMMSEIDEYGEKHIIFCRVILGNLEKVELGSRQLFPSSVDFDTGVDDLNNPQLYVVWCNNMNTHILPECIVSYKSGRHMSGQLNGAPHANHPWSTLITKLNSFLPQPKVLQLQRLYGVYLEGKVGREFFMRQLRCIVGDGVLRSTILEIRG
ncbi:hypothetical protein HAX54_004783 [Datura stramonium]|uniref:PARP n=1 Tax=Datura stramonium TaxID=4076 RepID=A0ABS8T8Z0_DATST|nr:hypothetical protein [Datura stramonium]